MHLRENPGYVYEKMAPPYVGMGPPQWLIRPWIC